MTTIPTPIRVGIVGASADPFAWASVAHVPALRSLPEYELVAVASRNQENAESAAATHGISNAFGDYRAMLSRNDIDLICVSTSSAHHYDLTMAAIDAGKYVFCEWPFGSSTAQAIEMRDFARQRGVRTLVGLQNRCAPIVRFIGDLISEGYIGTLWSANFDRANDQTARMKVTRAYLDFLERADAGLRIMGGHALDTLAAYVGEFVDLQAYMEIEMKSIILADTGELAPVHHRDHILVQGRLNEGAVVSVMMKQNSPTYKAFHLEISGSKGALVVTTEGDLDASDRHPGVPSDYVIYGTPELGRPFERLTIPARYRTVPTDTPDGQPLNVAHMYQAFAKASAEDRQVELDFDHGVQRHLLLDAISQSAERGSRLSI